MNTATVKKLACAIKSIAALKAALRFTYAFFPLKAPAAHPQVNTGSKQILLDVSVICRADAGTGIQRVVRAIAKSLLENPPPSYAVRPVWADLYSDGYKYAEFVIAEGAYTFLPGNTPIMAGGGDIFLGLDFVPYIVAAQKTNLDRIRALGARVCFVVYDILPITHPRFFPFGARRLHISWLKRIAAYDGLLCISRTVRDEVAQWLGRHAPSFPQTAISCFRLGSDIENSAPSRGLPDNASAMLRQLAGALSFLMVSTLEPRKGHAQVLDAFELLWARGVDATLVLVGKPGWKVEKLVARIKSHPENTRRFVWLDDVSDEYLGKLYAACRAVIMASECEGFGLSIIEGARHNKALIVRNIPVFREAAGECATWFEGREPRNLAAVLQAWITQHKNGRSFQPASMHPLSWKESAAMLLSRLPLQQTEATA